MNTSAWIVVAIIAAFGIAVLVSTYGAGARRASADTFERSIGIPLIDGLRGVVTERVALRHRGGAIGQIAGIAASAFILSMDPTSGDQFATAFLLIGGAFAGQAVGVALAARHAAAPLDPDAVKYARSNAVALSDYVAPLERIGGRVVVALGVVALIAAIASGAAVSGVLVALAALSVAALLVFEIAGRRLVDRAQPAESPAGLTWDDAVRASVLRDMMTAPIILGADTVVVAGGAFIDHVLAGNLTAQIALVVATLVVAALLAIASIVTRPQRYFLTRLWPKATA